jgi:hypothetical protein
LANQTKPQGLEAADPIVAIRVALNPIVRRPDGTEELLGEIWAEGFEVPPTWEFIESMETRWKGRDAGGWPHLEYGPDANMKPGTAAAFVSDWDKRAKP